MGARPKGKKLSVRDPKRGYQPGNCLWAPAREAVTLNHILLTCRGVTMNRSRWARRLGITPSAISYHLENRKSFERLVDKYEGREVRERRFRRKRKR